MAKKVIKYEATKEDYEFGNLSLDQLFNLMYLTSYFVLKFKINDILDFYKKLHPNMCGQEEMWSKRIAYIVDNSILRHEDANIYNKMQISDKEILMRIKTLLNSFLPF